MTINRTAGHLNIDKVPASDIAKKFKTPCYVYSKIAIEQSFNQFKYAFEGRKNLICYAVKANSNIFEWYTFCPIIFFYSICLYFWLILVRLF